MARLKNIICLLLPMLAACTSTIPSKPVEFMLYTRGMTLKVHGAYVTPAFFEQTGTRPLAGRLFAPQEYSANLLAVILSNAAWKTRFHSDAAKTIGNSVRLSGVDYTIVGVMPASFDTPAEAEFLIPKEKLAR